MPDDSPQPQPATPRDALSAKALRAIALNVDELRARCLHDAADTIDRLLAEKARAEKAIAALVDWAGEEADGPHWEMPDTLKKKRAACDAAIRAGYGVLAAAATDPATKTLLTRICERMDRDAATLAATAPAATETTTPVEDQKRANAREFVTTVLRVHFGQDPTPETIERVIDKVLKAMPPAEAEVQRQSFARGNVEIDRASRDAGEGKGAGKYGGG